jgi:RNA polymerase sigma-70 factor, ECF subfamily
VAIDTPADTEVAKGTPADTEAAPDGGDAALVAALRRGDEASFLVLVDRYHTSMVRVARGHVPTDAVAEEVAQEAWLGVLSGIAGFEGRSSLKTWIFRILINCAKGRGRRERRSIPFSALGSGDDAAEPTVPAERFFSGTHLRWAGHWVDRPEPWADDRLLSRETLSVMQRAIEQLSAEQREVVLLRDVEEWSADEVCDALGLSEGNQRVLLHRGRAKVRRALEEHMTGARGPS